MKRCPECRRDYYDDTLVFCLDDGATLLEGPASSSETNTKLFSSTDINDEPQTAIFSTPSDEAPTKPQIRLTERTAVLPEGEIENPHQLHPHTASTKNSIIAGIIGIVLVTALGIGSYWLYGTRTNEQIESIAVMPFENASGNSDVEYLSDGMTETLIRSLSNIPNLSVKARSTVFYYKGREVSPKKIGEELNVQTVLLGRVVQRGDDLKLNLELVNTGTQDVIWSEQYNRKQADLVNLQSEIARDVLSKLKTKLSGIEEARVTKNYTENAEAYQLFLKGRYYWSKRTAENLRKATQQFRAAADLDPNYALAYVGLADCYVVMEEYAGTPTSETLPQAKAFATRALQIDESLAEAHASLGLINYMLWEWDEIEAEFKRAIELNPNYPTAHHWYSVYLRAMGQYDKALTGIKRAQELDPLSLAIHVNIADVYILKGDTDATVEQLKKVIELDPNFPYARIALGRAYLKQRRNNEALTELQKGVELSDRSNISLESLGYGYAVSGNRNYAVAIVKELEERYSRREAVGFSIARVHTGLGEKDQAFAWLEKDFKARSGQLVRIKWEPEFESLRDDPRFQDLLQRMGLPQ